MYPVVVFILIMQLDYSLGGNKTKTHHLWYPCHLFDYCDLTVHMFAARKGEATIEYVYETHIDTIDIFKLRTTRYAFNQCKRNVTVNETMYEVIIITSNVNVDITVITTDRAYIIEAAKLVDRSKWGNQYTLFQTHSCKAALLFSLEDVDVRVYDPKQAPITIQLKRYTPYEIDIKSVAKDDCAYIGTFISADEPIGVLLVGELLVEFYIVTFLSEMLSAPIIHSNTSRTVWFIMGSNKYFPEISYYLLPAVKNTSYFTRDPDDFSCTLEDLHSFTKLSTTTRKSVSILVADHSPLIYFATGPSEILSPLAYQGSYFNYIIDPLVQDENLLYNLVVFSADIVKILIDGSPVEKWDEIIRVGTIHLAITELKDSYTYITSFENSFLAFVVFKLRTADGGDLYSHIPLATDNVELERDVKSAAKANTETRMPELLEHYVFHCPTSTFGTKCAEKCECPDSFCRKNGSCYTGDCPMGSFGTNCMYEDLTVYAITNSEEMLTDGDDSTCVFPSFNKFNLRFFEHFYVASIVFVLFEEGVFESDTFIVSYKTMESYGFLSEFKSVTAMITNVISNRVYVELEDAVLLDLIEIEVKFHLSICSVYLNGGINLMRNLVPARLVVEVSNANDKLLSIITDGDRYRTCVDVTSPLVIVLKPQNNTRVSRVAIYAGNQVMISMPYSITNEKESFKKDGFAMWPRPWNPTFVHDKWISTLRISPGVKHLTLCEVEVYADIFTPRVPVTDSAAAGDTIFRFWGFVALFIVVASCLSCTIFAMNKRVDLAPELEDE